MHLFDQRLLGIGILLLLGLLVAIKQVATGSVLDRPKGNFVVQLVNVFNLLFLLIVNPLAAVLLILRRLPGLDPAHLVIKDPSVLMGLELAGLILYVAGVLFMAWALVTLGRNYQLGGMDPRTGDRMVTTGPYGLVRHPMYSSALAISIGLACLIQSWAVLGVFCVYLVLILALIPMEEDGLRRSFGETYLAYRKKARKLIPLIY